MTILFTFPGYEDLAKKINQDLQLDMGEVVVRNFPDGESYVRIMSDVKGQDVVLLCGLDNPDSKIMAIMFFVNVAKELGVKRMGLVSPYLGYMRQDIRFNDGEAITSNIFAEFLSIQFDWLVTIDPHLHRHKSLKEIYSIPSRVLHASDNISDWVKTNISKPLLIGPDEESEQWVKEVAEKIGIDFIVLKKVRYGDKRVEVSVPDVEKYIGHTPVLIDDIISTARTMIETVGHVVDAGMKAPICIGVHAIFAGGAYEELKKSGAAGIVSCNTIAHDSNQIDISNIISVAVRNFI